MAEKKEPSFEKNMENLQEIMEKVEGGELGLQDTIGKFEEGMNMIKACRDILDKAELRINKLIGESGKTEPFEPGE